MINRKSKPKRAPATREWVTITNGGEDLISPAIAISSEDAIYTQNFDATPNGYERSGAFEPFNGTIRPSEATYHWLEVDAWTDGSLAISIEGATSGATAIVSRIVKYPFDNGSSKVYPGGTLTVETPADAAYGTFVVHHVEVTSGSWITGDAAGNLYCSQNSGGAPGADLDGYKVYDPLATIPNLLLSAAAEYVSVADGAGTIGLPIIELDGTFQLGENVEDSSTATVVGTVGAVQVARGAPTDAVDRAALLAAVYSRNIFVYEFPNSVDQAPITGLAQLEGYLYAMSNAPGGTQSAVWVQSHPDYVPGAWDSLDTGTYINFDAGSGAFAVGDTVTGATSGASATVDAVMILSGSTGSSNQVGRLYLSSITGTFSDNENLQVSAVTKAVADGTQTALTIPPNGRWECVTYNFTGDPAQEKIYAVNGVSDLIEIDQSGNVYEIPTNSSGLKPTHIAVHKEHLFVALGHSVQHSVILSPRDWSGVTGAVEFALGDVCTGMAAAGGGTLAVFNRSRTRVLYGTTKDDWEMKTLPGEMGAIEWSIASISDPIFLDDTGLHYLTAVQDFGDFRTKPISEHVEPIVTEKKLSTIAAVQVKSKNQYRLYYDDGTALHFRLDRKKAGATRWKVDSTYKPNVVISFEDLDGKARTYMGCANGGVYELDQGMQADGEPIESYLRLAPWDMKSPRLQKRFLQVILGIDARYGVDIQYVVEYDFGDWSTPRDTSTTDMNLPESLGTITGGGYWGVDEYGDFVWGAQVFGEARADLAGGGRNMSLILYGKSSDELPYTIQSAIVRYIPRGREA